MREFLSKFRFLPQYTLMVGVERERFIVNQEGKPQPQAERALALLPKDGRFGYELSACQLEDRVGPLPITEVRRHLRQNDALIRAVLNELGLQYRFCEVAPIDMDTTVFNDPTGRYQQIVRRLNNEELLAACRVAATHVHVGMPDMTSALRVYNQVIPHWRELCEVIHHSKGERLSIYRQMAPDYVPRKYESLEAFYGYANTQGFANDPRQNWQLIRLSVHGTIEFRMGGATDSYDEVVAYASACHRLCANALAQKVVC